MLAKVNSMAVVGLESYPVEVEVDIGQGLPALNIVGLPDKSVEESKERVRAAIKNSGANFPMSRITVNLAPADLKKEGSAHDLAIAVGVLIADKQIPKKDIGKSIFVGELALEGNLRHVSGILPIVMFAKEKNYERIYLPQMNAIEASLIEDIEIIPVKSLNELILHLKEEKNIGPFKGTFDLSQTQYDSQNDFAYIKGQESAKRALEIAAAGGHNVIMNGPPGSGKTLLAKSFASILPELSKNDVLEVTKIYSISGMLPSDTPLVTKRPFRNPHHTASHIAIVGGGAWPKPGEITLSHRGVLFLDEFPEFPRSVLEALRQPLEDGMVTVSRASGSLSFPARFILIAAQNPCPCGYLTDPEKQCICTPTQIIRYQKRLSGPILDRIDLHIEVPRVKYDELSKESVAESSESIRNRINNARKIQAKRFTQPNLSRSLSREQSRGVDSITSINAEMRPQEIKKYCQIDDSSQDLLKSAVNQFHLSARAYYRIIKLARTIADLEGAENIKPEHIAEALQYRPKENRY